MMAINGTTNCVILAMRSTPPTIISPASTAKPMPTAKGGMLKATVTAEEMELDWVALPMKPSAIISAIEKPPERKRAALRPIFGVSPCVM